MLQQLDPVSCWRSFLSLEETYADISWRRTLHRCTWLWGCAPAERMWGCTQTAEGTGSRRHRCRWNWCTPAEKHTTTVRSGDHPGSEQQEKVWFSHFSHCEGKSIAAAFHFYVGLRHLDRAAVPHLSERQMGEKLEPLIYSHDVNGEMFSHKPLKCFCHDTGWNSSNWIE